MDAFFFSVQTFATIGYGKLVPNGLMPNLLGDAGSLIGLLGVALATGLVFARFSRPNARMLYSNVAVIARHDKIPSLMFRMANLRSNQIVEAVVVHNFVRTETTVEGESYRTFTDLALERSRNPMFVLSWLSGASRSTKDSPLTWSDLEGSAGDGCGNPGLLDWDR